jgi:hypothetical protein
MTSKPQPNSSRVYKYMTQHLGQPVHVTDVAEALGLVKTQANGALTKLANEGMVQHSGLRGTYICMGKNGSKPAEPAPEDLSGQMMEIVGRSQDGTIVARREDGTLWRCQPL